MWALEQFMSDGLRVLHNKRAIYKDKEEYSNKDKILWWKLSKKKNLGRWKANRKEGVLDLHTT